MNGEMDDEEMKNLGLMVDDDYGNEEGELENDELGLADEDAEDDDDDDDNVNGVLGKRGKNEDSKSEDEDDEDEEDDLEGPNKI